MGRRDKLVPKVMFTAMQQLEQNCGTLDVATLRQKVEQHTNLDAGDMVILPHGPSRWRSALERYSHEYVKAQLITKDRGRWSITTQGINALSGGESTAFDIARGAYNRWKKRNRRESHKS